MANSSLTSSSLLSTLSFMITTVQNQPCNFKTHETDEAKCEFLLSSAQCNPSGYINYLRIFYCFFAHQHSLGLTVLLLWLIFLFYLLGSTAATYFCPNLEGLSTLLKLSPAIAGATLLALGNGAPDVFSSIVSFGGSGGDFGLNSVLGGALFVSTVVVGVVSVSVEARGVEVEKLDFVRDACFLMFVLLSLTVILVAGEISVWVALAFALLYLIYILLVYITHRFGGIVNHEEEKKKPALFDAEAAKAELKTPLLKQSEFPNKTNQQINLLAIKSLLELPLNLPRRLTIPDISDRRWSKPFAVTSAATSPLILATLTSPNQIPLAAILGSIAALAAFFTTQRQNPPTRFRLPWLAGGFVMSVTWTYVAAKELVSLLVSIGGLIGIGPGLLGLTVLAWGDSLGDLVAAAAVARGGGEGGVQVAVTGCYAGPTFNVLVGLGFPMGMRAWAGWPEAAVVEADSGVFETVGFLVGGILWALLILPRRGMRPDRVLGGGLFAIYLCFLCVRFGSSFGLFEV